MSQTKEKEQQQLPKSTVMNLIQLFGSVACVFLAWSFSAAGPKSLSSSLTTAFSLDTTTEGGGEDKENIIYEEDPWFLNEDAASYNGNYDNFWEELQCDDVFNEYKEDDSDDEEDDEDEDDDDEDDEEIVVPRIRPIHDDSVWMLLRGAYVASVGGFHHSSIPVENIYKPNGFKVPVKVVQLEGKGRAIIAVEDIPQGTVVWDPIHTAKFPTPVEFRRFLLSIPRDLACDVMIWAYSTHFDKNGDDDDDDDEEEEEEEEDEEEEDQSAGGETIKRRPTIAVDLDIGSLINTKDSKNPKNIDNDTYQAMRLIKAGEEILVDYSEFETAGSWGAAGFGSADEDAIVNVVDE